MKVRTAKLRVTAKEIFVQSLMHCSVEQAFARLVKVSDGGRQLLIDGIEPIDLERMRHIRVVAAGKASAAMLAALLKCLKVVSQDLAGVLIAGERPLDLQPGFQFFAGGHPLPNEASQQGARTALEMLRDVKSRETEISATLCFFLISGGASAMMELPLDPSIPLVDTISFHRELVHSGASIAEINCIRKHFSAVKGGRLALAADEIENLSLLISDVPRDHLDALASGPTLSDTSTVKQCHEILARYHLQNRFPISVRRFFERADLPETPKPGSFPAKTVTLLSSDNLAEAARKRAEELGFYAIIDNTCDDWDYAAAADYLINRIRSLKRLFPRVCLISSGEVTVRLPKANDEAREMLSGVGGRNQHFSLYAATLLEPSDASIVILSAGSDGIDGNSPAAGAIVDEETLRPNAGYRREENPEDRGNEERMDAARRSLLHFDSHTFLQEMGATIVTGATGNNLRDLRILLGASA